MNRVVREHYRLGALPESLRPGLPKDVTARITVEEEAPASRNKPTTDSLFERARPSFSSLEEAADYVKSLRQDWD